MERRLCPQLQKSKKLVDNSDSCHWTLRKVQNHVAEFCCLHLLCFLKPLFVHQTRSVQPKPRFGSLVTLLGHVWTAKTPGSVILVLVQLQSIAWSSGSHRDGTWLFQLHVSLPSVTRPCLYSGCICVMNSVWELFLSCTQLWIRADF